MSYDLSKKAILKSSPNNEYNTTTVINHVYAAP